MSPKPKTPAAASGKLSGTANGRLSVETLLRSINVVFDVAEPSRVAHFRPTGKSVSLLRALLGLQGEAAFVVVAPYGSAKSLASTYCAQVVENRDDARESIQIVGRRIANISQDLADTIATRVRKGQSGVVVALNGPTDNLGESLRTALLESLRRTGRKALAKRIEAVTWSSAEDFLAFLADITRQAKDAPDRLLLVWDEFGRHLESLVAGGRASELNDLQTLAEFASRQQSMLMTIALLMHQPMVQYAGSAPQGVRNEWAKIAGRFETVEFVDDSRETYRLLAEAMQARSGGGDAGGKVGTAARTITAEAKRLGLFADLPKTTLEELVHAAAPMHATALWLLPRTSARVAQNERTLFTFLGSVDAKSTVGLAEIYDYFAPVMRGDMATGGSYRQYLEAESAIAKCADIEFGAQAVKCACLLGLGLSGARARASRELVEFALSAYCGLQKANTIVSDLIKRKILLHRKHSNELSVWHGTDADLRGRLEAEMARRSEPLNVVAALNAELPAPVWKPIRYNDDFKVTRFYRSEYRRVADFAASVELMRASDAPFADGHVVYLIPESEAECARAREVAASLTKQTRNLVVALPAKPLRLAMPLGEIDAIHALQRDRELVDSDPLVTSELQQMLEDSRAHVQRTMDAVLAPDGKSTVWYADGKERTLGGAAALRELLSQQMEKRFPKAPRIANELVVRKKPTAVVVNARKKLVLAIMERSGKDALGIEGKSADHSMFRCLLLNTGLYRAQGDEAWRYAHPDEVADKGLRAVWAEFEEFVATPAPDSKPLGRFFAKLQEPPYGVRDGLIPILFAAALKAFPSPVTLSKGGEYVGDILPSTIEDLCRNPEEYRFTVLDLGAKECAYLSGVHQLFSGTEGTSPADGDLVRLAFESVGAWKRQLPPASLKTYRITPAAKKLRDAVNQPGDALVLLLNAMPRAVGYAADLEKAVEAIRAAKAELEEVPKRFEMAAADAVRRSLGVADVVDRGLRTICDVWIGAIPKSIREQLKANRDDPRPGALVDRMMIRYETDDQLLQSLCSIVSETRPARWEDTTPAVFARTFDDTVRRIEAAAVEAAVETKLTDDEKLSMAALGQARLRAVLGMLSDVVGRDEAARLAQDTINQLGRRVKA
jgi:hypothetical protein